MLQKLIRRFTPAVLVMLALISCAESKGGEQFLGPIQAGSGDDGYTVITESMPRDLLPGVSLSSVIGIRGGRISIAGHVLEVPAGAVTVPTLFTLTVPLNGNVEVDLSATVTDVLGNVIDVGSKGFEKPVKLTLTYARGTNVEDPADLFIAYMPNGDHSKHEKLPSKHEDKKKLVSTSLSHFSKYCMAYD